MKRSYVVSLIGIIAISVAALVGTLAVHNSPQLGLDLQGGVAVVLKPTRPVSSAILSETISVIRQRVDTLGVASPSIGRQGVGSQADIVVELPGVKNQQKAISVVGQTAQLLYRPVIKTLPPYQKPPKGTSAAAAATNPAYIPTTPSSKDTPSATVVLPQVQGGSVVGRYQLGPAALNGTVVQTAAGVFNPSSGHWGVNLTLTSKGSTAFNKMAAKYYKQQVAIVLNGFVQSAPVINSTSFQGHPRISGSSSAPFTKSQADSLALALKLGALPVPLHRLTVQTVSATLGKSSLTAGLVAGAIGLALVMAYMIFYYRALGLVVVAGLAISGALLYAIIALLSKTTGLALTLSGVTGLIVSIGIMVDSYVVYFERLKDEVRQGKTVRSSVDRSFARAYRTILNADAVSFLGALVLYLLTVGSVRGFAFMLGLSTLLNVVIAYFFIRPAVILVGRNRTFIEARVLGVAHGLASTAQAQQVRGGSSSNGRGRIGKAGAPA
ncbi:MAG: protein translocase subunit SecD [Acidimicrobiales bacterium]